MIDYASEDQISAVAQACRYFNTGGSAARRHNGAIDNISCRNCINWSGSQCARRVFDSVFTNLEQY